MDAIHKSSDGVFKSKILEDLPNITHGIVGKEFCSKYWQLFKSITKGQNYFSHETEFAKLICQHLNIQDYSIYLPCQTHSIAIAKIENNPCKLTKEADGIITNKKRCVIGVKTADCCPILLAEPHNEIVCVAHAGWKGSINGIVKASIKQMKLLGANLEYIKAVIGPTISAKCYEVQSEFIKNANLCDSKTKHFIIKQNKKYYFDLPSYIKFKLAECEIKNIFDTELCTYSRDTEMYSYRRSTHKGYKVSPYIYSFIALK